MEELKPGDLLDDLVLIQALHAGASARLFQARDESTGQNLAVKIPFGDILNNPLIYYHFQNEERLSRLFDHPNLVRFYDRAKSRQYLVMDFVEGRDLRSLLGSPEPLGIDEACRIIGQLAQGVAYLHGLGILHLDIKPENVILTPKGRAVLLDFGLSRHLGRPDLLAEDLDQPLGTPWYIAPEQLLGQRDEPASDIYALGLLLYELLTGRLPFDKAKSVTGAKARLRAEPMPPRHFRPELAPQLQQIILGCLAGRPEDRHPGGAALASDLAAWPELAPADSGRRTNRRRSASKWFKGLTAQSTYRKPEPSAWPGPVILAAVVDDDSARLVLEAALRQALLRDAELILVTVRDGNEGTGLELEQYQTELEGEHFLARLDSFGRILREAGLDLTFRLKRGRPAREIIALAQAMAVELIVTGPSRRRGFRKIFGGSLLQKLQDRAPCPVVTARPLSLPPLPESLAPADLGPVQLAALDLNLLDFWAAHQHLAADLHLAAAKDPSTPLEKEITDCPLAAWLTRISAPGHRPEVAGILSPAHEKFHQAARNLARAHRGGRTTEFQAIYQGQINPALNDLKQAIGQTSTELRRLSAIGLAGLEEKGEQDQGPILKLRAISDYFCDNPQSSPRACLAFIDSEDQRGGREDL